VSILPLKGSVLGTSWGGLRSAGVLAPIRGSQPARKQELKQAARSRGGVDRRGIAPGFVSDHTRLKTANARWGGGGGWDALCGRWSGHGLRGWHLGRCGSGGLSGGSGALQAAVAAGCQRTGGVAGRGVLVQHGVVLGHRGIAFQGLALPRCGSGHVPGAGGEPGAMGEGGGQGDEYRTGQDSKQPIPP